MRLATLASLLLLSLGAHAQEVALPSAPVSEAAQPAAAPVATPARGTSMSKVEAQYGAPTERHTAVGTPPITRWDYPGFSVFFEYQHVVHAVVK